MNFSSQQLAELRHVNNAIQAIFRGNPYELSLDLSYDLVQAEVSVAPPEEDSDESTGEASITVSIGQPESLVVLHAVYTMYSFQEYLDWVNPILNSIPKD